MKSMTGYGYKEYSDENYFLSANGVNNSINSEIIKQSIGELFKLRNDFVFLHISVKGSNFGDLHTLLNEYYKKADDDIDALLELYVGVFKKGFNLNEFKNSSVLDNSVFRIKNVWFFSLPAIDITTAPLQ